MKRMSNMKTPCVLEWFEIILYNLNKKIQYIGLNIKRGRHAETPCCTETHKFTLALVSRRKKRERGKTPYGCINIYSAVEKEIPTETWPTMRGLASIYIERWRGNDKEKYGTEKKEKKRTAALLTSSFQMLISKTPSNCSRGNIKNKSV